MKMKRKKYYKNYFSSKKLQNENVRKKSGKCEMRNG